MKQNESGIFHLLVVVAGKLPQLQEPPRYSTTKSMDLGFAPPFLWTKSLVGLLELEPFGLEKYGAKLIFWIWSSVELYQACP